MPFYTDIISFMNSKVEFIVFVAVGILVLQNYLLTNKTARYTNNRILITHLYVCLRLIGDVGNKEIGFKNFSSIY